MQLQDDFRARLEQVLACPTAPFHEGAVHGVIRGAVAASGRLRQRTDDWGNHEVVYGPGRPRLLFACHTDHPALEANGDGTATVRGGIRPGHLKGAELRLLEGPGVVATVGAHVKKAPGVVLRLKGGGGLRKGTPLLLDIPDHRISQRFVRGRAIDDLCAVAALLAMFDRLERAKFKGTVGALFTRAEEVGCIGAMGWTRATRYPRSTLVVNLEMSPELKHTPQGKGPILRVGDRLTTFTTAVSMDLEQVAMRLKKRDPEFRYQRALMDGGACEATIYNLAGFRSGALCLPLRNYHNHRKAGGMGLEQVSASDAEGLVRWLVAYARECGKVRSNLDRRLDQLWRKHKRELGRSAGEGLGA